MFVETIEAISTGVSVFEISEKLSPTIRRVFNLLKNGKLKIAIFGAGGTGKTTLGKILSGEFTLNDLFQGYQESIATEQYKLGGDVFGSVIVAPGQARREDTWNDLLRSLSGGEIKLIIHVVSWGYHSLGESSYLQKSSYGQHALYQNGMTPEQFVEVYAKDCRKRELDVLSKIAPHLAIADQNKTIMITLVTKQDLWWRDRLKVKEYYIGGNYEELIQDIRNKLGSANFTHDYHSTSLVIENLISGNNEFLVPTAQGYDERLKFANFRSFLNNIEALFNISLNTLES